MNSKQSARVNVRVPKKTREALERLANRAKRGDFSDYIRFVFDEHLAREKKAAVA